ncbi:MAG: hypothetical protein MSA90_15205 [Faecalicatena sp.]|uniref:hypothetical protein n=1 Tax=Faecalicatena sp. TaxID=2005360 RepID=UPI0025877772|nr:hypothetical protein [Faecalicatena sp.]MCI6466799.1 hypothetical protein [Faecalicatena sp.]MDY5620592.1 hypothetical protein [Lachnospiraceae bacterium]
MKNQFYKNTEQNAAFIRCIDVMTRLIQKYGLAVLEETRKKNEQFAVSHNKRQRSMKYLQTQEKGYGIIKLCMHSGLF